MILIAVATPIGEELAFRACLRVPCLGSALDRYFVSALVFALAHGLNEITPIAFITGVATSYLFYRTKSVWPGVIVHVVNNALATIFSVLIASML
jgi:membrane protease YdiL (CAAX protease family)